MPPGDEEHSHWSLSGDHGRVCLRRVATHQVPVPVLLSAAGSVVPILRPRRTLSVHDPYGESDGGGNSNQCGSHLSISGRSRSNLSFRPRDRTRITG